MKNYILDANSKPEACEDILMWAEWFEGANKLRRVGYTNIDKDTFVSTVFLGVDYNFDGKGKPILWETMIFVRHESVYVNRYTSVSAARKGHREAVKIAKTNQNDNMDKRERDGIVGGTENNDSAGGS